MRIIAGTARGMNLFSPPKDAKTRPLTDMARGALFNIIGPDIQNSKFLDLFAGTGAVGIEALSRGAESAALVEKNPKVVQVIKKNLEKARLINQANVVQSDVFYFMETMPAAYDYIFIGPPQFLSLWSKSLNALDKHPDFLKNDGWAILQCDPSEYEEKAYQNLIQFDQRKYGSVLLTFFEKKKNG